MEPLRLNSKDVLAPAWAGVGEQAHMPVRADGARPYAGAHVDVARDGDSRTSGDATVRRPWWRTALRVARDATIGLLLIAAVPVTFVAVLGVRSVPDNSTLLERMAQVEPMRAVTSPIDRTITPMQAGIALHELQRHPPHSTFPTLAVSAPVERPWETLELSPDMFTSLTAFGGFRGPSPTEVIAAAVNGFSDAELAYLRAVAESPTWNTVDVVATAAEVDVIGGEFVLPFRPNARAYNMPIPSFADSKALAYAANVRAAYYLAIGQPERAEAALRSIVSLGFAYMDDGRSTVEALIGRVLVGIARDGLHQLYTATGDLAGMALTKPLPPIATTPDPRSSAAEPAASLNTRANTDEQTLPRAIRLERVMLQTMTSCGSVQTMLFPESDGSRTFFERERADLARYPSERAYMDLIASTSSVLPTTADSDLHFIPRLIIGAASVTSTVLHNPRIETCTRLTVNFWR